MIPPFRYATIVAMLAAFVIAALASVSLALSRFGVNDAGWDPKAIGRWFATHGINAVLILAGAFAVIRAANLAIEHMQFKLSRRHAATDEEWQRRAATLGGILTSLVTTAVGFIAILMLLRELSFDVVPILTGAGIYSEHFDRVAGTAREVGASMERDAVWAPLLLAPLDIVGIESLADGAATLRVKFKTQPLGQGKVANELRRRLMTTFVGRGIRPFSGC